MDENFSNAAWDVNQDGRITLATEATGDVWERPLFSIGRHVNMAVYTVIHYKTNTMKNSMNQQYVTEEMIK